MAHALVAALRARGTDVQTALEARLIECPDELHLAHAADVGRCLCTFNAGDFHRLHVAYVAEGRSHTGIVIMAQQRYTVGEQMRRLLRLASSIAAEDMRDRIEFLSGW